jgi:N-acetylglucosamine malate deacetylase 2
MLPKILFIFPHPDDESFLCGGTIARYAHGGDAEVFLYTLTHGEASRNAAFLGITREQIAALRTEEVRHAASILGVKEHMQGDYPDGGLCELDPRDLEADFTAVIRRIEPTVLVTFDVQGGSVHPDHITAHHIVKRVFVTLRETMPSLKRLAFAGLPHEKTADWPRKVFDFKEAAIDAVIPVGDYIEYEMRAVAAHESVRRDVEEHNYDRWMFWENEFYSFFQESFKPPVNDLLAGLG